MVVTEDGVVQGLMFKTDPNPDPNTFKRSLVPLKQVNSKEDLVRP